MPVLSQAVLAGQRAQPSPQTEAWQVDNDAWGGLAIQNSDPNFASLFPGVQDFCWETWVNPSAWTNQPGLIVAWGLGSGPPATSNLSLTVSPNFDGSNGIAFDAYIMGVATTRIATLTSSYWNTWIHLAFCRIGSTINVYANGILVGQMTSVTTNLDLTTVAADQWWTYTGPVGDRDQSYDYPVGGNWRNMRYTVGNNVYGNVSSFTPPPLEVNLAPVSGTQFIFWPDENTNLSVTPVVADYASVTYQFTRWNGNATNTYPTSALYAYPQNILITPSSVYDATAKGTWTNNGTAPNQPKITTAGPSPIIGTSCGDFTATGTNVRISSSDTSAANMSGSFLIYIWFYVPANITNEKKTILAVENTDGLVLNIGRTGQGLDWLSISAYGGAELTYGQHIWARNAWNFLCVQKQFQGVAGPLTAWAGAAGDNYATAINLSADITATTFANSGNISIGCTSGSTVSSQMYFNQILIFNSGFGGYQTGVYAYNATSIPIFILPTINYQNAGLSAAFDFQGTNGNTNIQPVYPT